MDKTIEVRSGEELDYSRLTEYLRRNLDSGSDLSIEQFPAGSSNLTYLVRIGDDEFVLRRPPFGNTVKSAHDMKREYDVLSKLSAIYAPAPRPLLFCDDDSVLGSEFYLMERRNGLVIRGRSPEALGTNSQLQIDVCRAFIQNLVELHQIDYQAAGLGNLGNPAGYNRRQVEGWTKRYIAAKTDEWPDIEKAIIWLNDNIAAESGAALIHNDYKFDNVMLDPNDLTKITAVLDWEMVTIGDPLMDLGTTLGYWMSKDVGDELLSMPFNPRILMENITRQQLVEMYFEILERKAPDMLFYYVFGTFKIAVIAQQIYSRFVRGHTQDKRFANFNKFVASLGLIAASAISRRSV